MPIRISNLVVIEANIPAYTCIAQSKEMLMNLYNEEGVPFSEPRWTLEAIALHAIIPTLAFVETMSCTRQDLKMVIDETLRRMPKSIE
ncbi:uncharacterized protein ARMOST_02204 [Armillaria ostoyae]|uniref:Uncharacterized protein n=1 Tax=Armillaria ostoyae TaxID=47428 RepID=A0A284QR46_ARMOS|nr:uncharacterized protein ARMOST_02204 [Armillaria ostoyae]